MSRIEEALEKAARLRGQNPSFCQENKSEAQHPLPLQNATSSIKVSNQLLVTASDPNTPAAEEYRKLKSSIVHLTKRDQFSNLIMVTSSIGSEGKSITALNLAMSLAMEYDHTVMLVDGDLRKPSLHKYLGIEQRQGLTDCLVDGLDVKDTLLKTGIGRLSLMTAGRAVEHPGEIFSSRRATEFFLELRNRYHDRYVIIDTPPVLPFAETRSMCRFVDGVILVVKEGGVGLDKISETIACLKGSSLLGIVYNQACTERENNLYYHYYRQGIEGESCALAGQKAAAP